MRRRMNERAIERQRNRCRLIHASNVVAVEEAEITGRAICYLFSPNSTQSKALQIFLFFLSLFSSRAQFSAIASVRGVAKQSSYTRTN